MIRRSIKVKLILTLAILLSIGLLLTSVVIIMFWQRQCLQSEVAKDKLLLHVAAASLNGEDHGQERLHDKAQQVLSILQGDTSLTCLRVKNGSDMYSLLPSCSANEHLDSILVSVARSGRKKHLFFGASWGVFSYGNSELLMAIPLYHNGEVVGSIGLRQDLIPVYQEIRSDMKLALIYLLANVVILTALGFLRLVKMVVDPLENLVTLADSDFGEEGYLFYESNSGDEFAQLSRSLNRMLRKIGADNVKLRDNVKSLALANEELQKNRVEMVRAEKLASVGRLSAGLAHEIGNPLGIVNGYLEILADDNLTDEEKDQYLLRAGQEVDRINTLIRQLLDFSRFSSREISTFSVHSTIHKTIELMQLNDKTPIQYVEHLEAENDHVEANEDSLRQVIVNCLLNAVDAVQEANTVDGGLIVISTQNRSREKDDSEVIVLTISDNGTGIPEENIDKIFDPFFTTKEVGQGTGLGLFVSHTIIENFQGRMHVKSGTGQGTELIIELPVRVNEKK